MKIELIDEFKLFMKNTFTNFNDIPYLKYYILLKKYAFNTDFINKCRLILEKPICDHINKLNVNKVHKLKDKIKANDCECYEEWPICMHDSISSHKICSTFVFREACEPLIIDDYIDINNNYNKTDIVDETISNIANNISNNISSIYNSNTKSYFKSRDYSNFSSYSNSHSKAYAYTYSKDLDFHNIIIERRTHKCRDEKRIRNMFSHNPNPSKMLSILDQMNVTDESINLFSRTADKSLDTTERSFECSHEVKKKNYKEMRKNAKFLSSVVSQNKSKKEVDFDNFILKIHGKCK